MKKATLIILILFLKLSAFSQELNSQAQAIKIDLPKVYENILKKHAINKWGDNYQMVVHNINEQSSAIFKCLELFKAEHGEIFYNTVLKWSYDGYKQRNKEILKSAGDIELVYLHCNWTMVLHDYKNQVKAKQALE